MCVFQIVCVGESKGVFVKVWCVSVNLHTHTEGFVT